MARRRQSRPAGVPAGSKRLSGTDFWRSGSGASSTLFANIGGGEVRKMPLGTTPNLSRFAGRLSVFPPRGSNFAPGAWKATEFGERVEATAAPRRRRRRTTAAKPKTTRRGLARARPGTGTARGFIGGGAVLAGLANPAAGGGN